MPGGQCSLPALEGGQAAAGRPYSGGGCTGGEADGAVVEEGGRAKTKAGALAAGGASKALAHLHQRGGSGAGRWVVVGLGAGVGKKKVRERRRKKVEEIR